MSLQVIIATHSYATGPSQELLKYLKPRAPLLAYIDHPFTYARAINSSVSLYQDGQQIKRIVAPAIKSPEVLVYIKDLALSVLFPMLLFRRFDLYVGVDSLNAMAGLILKKLGLVKRVIFYTIDYAPRRFENNFLNKIYHQFDKICCYNCDLVWNVSPVMADERDKQGVLKNKSAPQIVVPLGNNFNEINRLPLEAIQRKTLAFMGHLKEHQGLEFLIGAFPEIRKKVPEARLVIIGGGYLQDSLQNLAANLGLQDCITFTGFIEDHAELERILAGCAVGVAPYEPSDKSYTFYADPGKPKAYMACGLPVVITKVPQIAYEIDKVRAGFAIDYDRPQLVDRLVSLLRDDKLYAEYRQNAIDFARQYAWENIFGRVLPYSIEKIREIHGK